MQTLALLSCDLYSKRLVAVVQNVPDVPIVQSLTAVQSSKVQRSMTRPRQTVPGFRESLKGRNEQQDVIFFRQKEETYLTNNVGGVSG